MALQPDLSDFAEDARRRFARLSVSAGERFFSPRGSGHLPSVQFPSTPARAAEPYVAVAPDASVGSSGEFFSPPHSGGGVSGLLPVVLMKPEFLRSLCLGAVSKGLKFCTLGAEACTYSTHSMKIKVVPKDLYIMADNKSAFANHHIPASLLSGDQLATILTERHTKDEWVRLLHAWNAQAKQGSLEVAKPSATRFSRVGSLMVSTMVTPARKRKSLYDVLENPDGDDGFPDLTATSSSFSSQTSESSDYDIVPADAASILQKDFQDLNPESLNEKWQTIMSILNRNSSFLNQLRKSFGQEIDFLQDKITWWTPELDPCQDREF